MTPIHYKGLVSYEKIDGNLRLIFKSPFNQPWEWVTDKVTTGMIEDWLDGELIQRAMPNLAVNEREYFLTGFNDKEQKEIFGCGEPVDNCICDEDDEAYNILMQEN